MIDPQIYTGREIASGEWVSGLLSDMELDFYVLKRYLPGVTSDGLRNYETSTVEIESIGKIEEEILYYKVLQDPPTMWTKKNHKIKLDAKGAVKEYDDFYLTANLFYSPPHWGTLYKIIDFVKDWLFPQIQDIPKLEKANLEIIYRYPSDGFDLDNKVYFWTKILLDTMKTPTSRQVLKAADYGRIIKSLQVLKDDSVRFVDRIDMRYVKGAPALIIKITGRREETQQTLF